MWFLGQPLTQQKHTQCKKKRKNCHNIKEYFRSGKIHLWAYFQMWTWKMSLFCSVFVSNLISILSVSVWNASIYYGLFLLRINQCKISLWKKESAFYFKRGILFNSALLFDIAHFKFWWRREFWCVYMQILEFSTAE